MIGEPPLRRTLPRLLFAFAGMALWFVLRWALSWGEGLISDASASVLSMVPTALLTILLVPRAENRWSASGFKWAPIAVGAALWIPLAQLLRGGAVPSFEQGWAVALSALLLYAVHEELAFRLFLADALSMGGRFALGTLLSTVLFTVVHMNNPFSNPLGMVNIFLAGLGLCLLRASGGGMAGAVAAHFLWNAGIGVAMGFGVSGYRFPAVFRPAFETGSFGPESSPFLTAVLLLMVVPGALKLFGRRRDG